TRASFDLDLGDLSALEHGADGSAAASRAEARKGQVAREILLGGRAHGVERALDVPAPEILGRGRLPARGRGNGPLQQIEPLLEVLARVNGEGAGHPQVVQGVLRRSPSPPSARPR